jgi:dihydroorotate dehydrogenase (NAD+) catalytic subunit
VTVARRSRRDVAPVDLRVTVGDLALPNPIVAASGTFGHGDEVARLCPPDQLGAVTVKSLAAFEWAGNPAPRLAPGAGGGMLNSVGLAGPGIEHWIEHELPSLRALGTRVIASVWGRTVDDFAVAAKMLEPAVNDVIAVEVNVSCPNLEDRSRMFAHSPESTAAVVRAVLDAGLELPVFAKLSPNTFEVVDVARAARSAGARGLTLVNTLLGLGIDAETRRPKLGAGGGGLSGPPLKPVALRVVHDVSRALPGMPIIGTGGVSSGEDVVEMLLAGASAVGVGTATFREPRAMLRILDELEAWCRDHRVTRVADLTAALEERDT